MKKIFAWVTLLSFLVFVSSCYSNKILAKQESINKLNYYYYGDVKVSRVITNQGDTIIFNRKKPGAAVNSNVNGNPQVRVLYGEIDSFVVKNKYSGIESFSSNGIRYDVYGQDSLGLITAEPNIIKIPISEIKQIDIRKEDPIKTLLCVGSVIVFVGLIVYYFSGAWDMGLHPN